MRIVSTVAAAARQAPNDSIQTLQREVERLKQEILFLRQQAAAIPIVKEKKVTPMPSTVQEPLFAKLWTYVNNQK